MGMEIVELALNIEDQYKIKLDAGFQTVEELFGQVLYKLQKKESTGKYLPMEIFDRINMADLDTVTIDLISSNIKAGDNNLVDISPQTPLVQLFPHCKRCWRWERISRAAAKQNWNWPELEPIPFFDRLCRQGCFLSLFSLIYLFIHSTASCQGFHEPLGNIGLFFFWSALIYIASYIVLVVLFTGVEYWFGLFSFPSECQTIDDLAAELKKINFNQCVHVIKEKLVDESNLTPEQTEVYQQLKQFVARIYDLREDEINFGTTF